MISALAVFSNGAFVACDHADGQLLLFDPVGAFVRKIGRRGSGPAEYRTCISVAIDRHENVIVYDALNGRLVRFSQSGEFVNTLSLPIAGYLGEGTFLLRGDGHLLLLAGAPGARAVDELERLQVIEMDSAGGRVDSVAIPSRRRGASGQAFALSTSDGDRLSVPPDTLWAVSPDGSVFIADPWKYEVWRRQPQRNDRLFARLSVPRVEMLPAEAAEWERISAFFARRGGPPLAPVPSVKPVIRNLTTDANGWLWVAVHTKAEKRELANRLLGPNAPPPLSFRERNRFDIFDIASNRHVGSLTLPAASRVLAARGDGLWLLREGTSGEHVIAKYRLTPDSIHTRR